MIRFRRWVEHNRRALKDIAAKREQRGVSASAPIAMQKVIVSVHLDGEFAAFADLVGGAVAETYFLRALQYAAEHDGASGTLRVARDAFGPVVLSRPWNVVGANVGRVVYDALLASTICVPLSADKSADLSADLSADKSADSRARAPASRLRRAHVAPTSRMSAPAHDAPAASPEPSCPQTGPRTCPRPPSPSPSSSLPTSPAGEGLVASPAAPAAPTLADCRNVLRRIVSSIRAEDADELRDAVERAIRGAGWEVERGPVGEPLANGRPGTIDLVVTWPQRIGIELDRKSPREKSLERLRSFDGHRVVVLRERPDEEIRIDGIEILVAGHAMPRAVTTCPRHGRIVTPEAPCSVCATLDTAPADPAVAAAALDEIKAKLARPKRVGEAKPAASPPPTLDPAERERIRATMGEESAA